MAITPDNPIYSALAFMNDQDKKIQDLNDAVTKQYSELIRLNNIIAAEDPRRDAIVGAAKAYMALDIPYVFGGTWTNSNPAKAKAFDCSGLVQQVYGSQGIKLPRVSADQCKQGKDVMGQDLLPGDLLGFDPDGDGTISHIGISLGGTQMIHTAKPGEDINICDWKARYKNLKAARRILI